MAKFVKKKMNVGLFLVLLLCAAVPGIIYLIYCLIPTRVPTKEPKNSGSLVRLVGTGLAFLMCVISLIAVDWVELGAAFVYLNTGLSALMLLMSVCNMQTKSIAAMTGTIFLSIVYIAVTVLLAMLTGIISSIWLTIPMFGGAIAGLVGVVMGTQYFTYHKYVEKEQPVETVEPVETAETKVEE